MRHHHGLDDFSQYAAARWETLVRTSVLLGLPLSAAQDLAVEAIARARSGLQDDGDRDLDVDLFGELIEAQRRDRRAWWRWPATTDDLRGREALESIEATLDRLTPAVRARAVLGAVALLRPEQVDEIVVGDSGPSEARLASAVDRAAQCVRVGPLDLAALTAGAKSRSRARWASSAVAVVLTLGLVVLAFSSADLHLNVGVPAASNSLPGVEPADGSAAASVIGDGEVPVAWFSGGTLRLGSRDVALTGVVALDTILGGVVATTEGGRVVAVDGSGARTPIARVAEGSKVAPGSQVATSTTGDVVAYIDSVTRELTVYDSGSGVVFARLSVDRSAEVAAVDGLETYVNDGDGYFVVKLGVATRGVREVTVLDAAAGAIAIAPEPGTIAILREGEIAYSTRADDVDLSPGGRFALISSPGGRVDGSATWKVRDVTQGLTIPLRPGDNGDAGEITDAAFAGDEAVVLVVRGPNASPLGDREDPSQTPRRSDLYTCALPAGGCVRTVRLGADSTGPLLAH